MTQRTFLTAEDFVQLPKTGTIAPNKIRFSQDSISPYFQAPELGSVADLTNKLLHGLIDPSSIEPIRIVEKDGMIFTLDNRRLKAFQDAEVEVPYVKLDRIPGREKFKFRTQNDGVSIVVREHGNR